MQRQPIQQRTELIDEGLQEPKRGLIGDRVVGIDQPGLERDVGLAAHDQDTEDAEDLAQVLLRQSRPERSW